MTEIETQRILIVDDEMWVREYLSEVLSDLGYHVDAIADDDESLKMLETGIYDLIVTDINMPHNDGFQVLKMAKSQFYRPEVLLITGQGSTQAAVQAVKAGAFDYLTKPIDTTRIHQTVEQALERGRLKKEIRRLNALNGRNLNYGITSDHLFFFDISTGLPNATLYRDRLQQSIKRYNDGHLAVLILAVDSFARVKEVFGSDIANEILLETANRLQDVVSERDTLALTNGWEFGILTEFKRESKLMQLIESVFDATSDTLSIGNHDILLSLSIGVSLYPADGEDADTIMNNARAALGIAQQTGRGGCQFFTPDRHAKAKELISTELLLSQCISDENFFLCYQPYYDIETNQPVGIEALLRLGTDNPPSMLPDQFIPILEETRLIVQVGEWVARAICDFVNRHSHLAIPVAMNISAIQLLRAEYSGRVARIIRENCIDPSLIVIELTESVFVQDSNGIAHRAITDLKETGCRVSIDDFGTGYSSLNYLKKFPFDTLKIDMSFIQEIDVSSDDRAIVSAIIAMARELNLGTVAEGVETSAQQEILRSMGCNSVQGFLLAKPMEEAELLDFLGAQIPSRIPV